MNKLEFLEGYTVKAKHNDFEVIGVLWGNAKCTIFVVTPKEGRPLFIDVKHYLNNLGEYDIEKLEDVVE